MAYGRLPTDAPEQPDKGLFNGCCNKQLMCFEPITEVW